MKIVKAILTMAAVAPLILLPKVMADLVLSGYDRKESILMGLGSTLPFVLAFVLALVVIEKYIERK